MTTTFHVGDHVQIISTDPHVGEFGNVVHVDHAGNPSVQLVFDPRNIGAMGYYRHELKLIRAAHKPGWERHGFVRNTHKWRMYGIPTGWIAVQPAQCEEPLFRTGYGLGTRSYGTALAELELAILKGKAALDLQEALS